MKRINTGDPARNKLLEGGYEPDSITTIYGPSGSGKTNLALLTTREIAKEKKVIYVDTEGSFSIERFKQVCPDYNNILKNIIFMKPVNFKEQKKVFEKLREIINESVGLIVIDTIAMLYRIELGRTKDVYEINRELGQQISYLSEIARKKNIPIILTNQVYSDFENKNNVKMVGGDILKYGSKTLIELKKYEQHRKLTLKKHRSIKENKEILFEITKDGIKEFIPQ